MSLGGAAVICTVSPAVIVSKIYSIAATACLFASNCLFISFSARIYQTARKSLQVVDLSTLYTADCRGFRCNQPKIALGERWKRVATCFPDSNQISVASNRWYYCQHLFIRAGWNFGSFTLSCSTGIYFSSIYLIRIPQLFYFSKFHDTTFLCSEVHLINLFAHVAFFFAQAGVTLCVDDACRLTDDAWRRLLTEQGSFTP